MTTARHREALKSYKPSRATRGAVDGGQVSAALRGVGRAGLRGRACLRLERRARRRSLSRARSSPRKQPHPGARPEITVRDHRPSPDGPQVIQADKPVDRCPQPARSRWIVANLGLRQQGGRWRLPGRHTDRAPFSPVVPSFARLEALWRVHRHCGAKWIMIRRGCRYGIATIVRVESLVIHEEVVDLLRRSKRSLVIGTIAAAGEVVCLVELPVVRDISLRVSSEYSDCRPGHHD